ncbi:hypothetical protein L596_016730 [Steinernema carpocapsae]|uniref:Uncharacterized protein n=1 Tax=Steinernema carpocapsae TaxID=34508 RepID=A0A4U5NIU2_STECR|nr:hypothetical protein L596_016730 [Steinernema carpocapsae]
MHFSCQFDYLGLQPVFSLISIVPLLEDALSSCNEVCKAKKNVKEPPEEASKPSLSRSRRSALKESKKHSSKPKESKHEEHEPQRTNDGTLEADYDEAGAEEGRRRAED